MKTCLALPTLALLAAHVVAQETLTLAVDGETFLPYQPIHLSADYTGSLPRNLNPAFGEMTIRVEDLDRSVARTYVSLAKACLPPNHPPGAGGHKATEILKISADGKQWLFEEPGEYLVSASLTGGASSNKVRVRIERPTTPEDIQAALRIRNCQGFREFHYMDGSDRLPEARALAFEYAAIASSYRRSMRDLMFRLFSQMSAGPSGEIRQPDPVQAASFYSPEDTDTPRHFGKLKTLWLLRRLDKISNREDFGEVLRAETGKIRRSGASMEALKRSAIGKDLL